MQVKKNYQSCLKWLKEELKSVTPSYEAEAKQMVMHFCNCDMIDLVLGAQEEISDELWALLSHALKRRLAEEPLQYILGYAFFMGNTFTVNPSVLIPRPETEVLVVEAIQYLKTLEKSNVQFLDMGVGSGAIFISILKAIPEAFATAVDIEEKAIEQAKLNATLNQVEKRVHWIQSDYFTDVPLQTYDLIVSNPPYIPIKDVELLRKEVAAFEPHEALFAGEDGLDAYRKIIPAAWNYLSSGGRLMFEAGHDQAPIIAEWMEKQGFVHVVTFKDLNEIPRFILGDKPDVEDEKNV